MITKRIVKASLEASVKTVWVHEEPELCLSLIGVYHDGETGAYHKFTKSLIGFDKEALTADGQVTERGFKELIGELDSEYSFDPTERDEYYYGGEGNSFDLETKAYADAEKEEK